MDGGGGNVRIRPYSEASGEFVLTDDGVGLTIDEVTELLATVGRSSKRDIFDLPRQDYLGQFGIGLLSCFMVADEIRIYSRSAKGGEPDRAARMASQLPMGRAARPEEVAEAIAWLLSGAASYTAGKFKIVMKGYA